MHALTSQLCRVETQHIRFATVCGVHRFQLQWTVMGVCCRLTNVSISDMVLSIEAVNPAGNPLGGCGGFCFGLLGADV